MTPVLPIRAKEPKSKLIKSSLTESRQPFEQACHLKYTVAWGSNGEEIQKQQKRASVAHPGDWDESVTSSRCKLQPSLGSLACVSPGRQGRTRFLSCCSLGSLQTNSLARLQFMKIILSRLNLAHVLSSRYAQEYDVFYYFIFQVNMTKTWNCLLNRGLSLKIEIPDQWRKSSVFPAGRSVIVYLAERLAVHSCLLAPVALL